VNGCSGNTSKCDGRDLMPVRLGLGRGEIRIFCGACRSTAAAMGLHVIERRIADVPDARRRDRRRFVPTWLRNLKARDMSGVLR
jgi:hypothetical protein